MTRHISKIARLLLFSVICLFGASWNAAALTATNLFPAAGATNVCPDTPLKIIFSGTPAAPTSGTVRIYTSIGTLVDTLNLGAPQTRVINGFVFTNNAVIINGSLASIFPHPGVLATNHSYYVNIDSTVFPGYAGISDSVTWTFTTKPALPPAGTNELVVAADNSADFATVQGAIDILPFGNTNHTLICIHNGIYQEIVDITNKNNLTFLGENRTNTVIEYANNENFNYKGLTTNVYRQSFGVDANDIVLENLSLTNTTPHGGGQAEVLRVDGQRFIANHASFHSYQDTLKVSGTVFFKDCYIEGDTDFIWGFGTAYFTNCETKALNGGHNTQSRSDANHYGYVFVNCSLTKSNGLAASSHDLGRWISSSHPSSDFGHVAYVNCKMDTHIKPAGWGAVTSTVQYWEYQSVMIDGVTPVNISSRESPSIQMSSTMAGWMRDPAIVFGLVSNSVPLGGGWLPQLAPDIAVPPASQTVSNSQAATFTVVAAGVPDPGFQWLKNSNPITGATNSLLTITNCQSSDAATYSVIVSNSVAIVTNGSAVLTVGSTTPQPILSAPTWNNGQFSLSVNGSSGANYSVQASTNLPPQWQTVFTTNSAATPFTWTDTNASYPAGFYRAVSQ